MGNSSDRVEWKQVCDDERVRIRKRDPQAENTLAGLAISGGGIRSATFALGLLESLRALNLLDKFHYLSTVSGGGFVGSWLSANCRRRAGWLTPPQPGERDSWTESIRYLRRYSNYLSPKVGFFSADTWSMITIWLRNTLLIQWTVILAIACALLLPHPLFALFDWWPHAGEWVIDLSFTTVDPRWITVLLFIYGIVGIAGNHWQLTTSATIDSRAPNRETPSHWWPPHSVYLLRAEWWRHAGAIAATLFVIALLVMRGFGFDAFGVFDVQTLTARAGIVRTLQALTVALLLVLSGFFLQAVAVRFVALWSSDRPEQVNYSQYWVQVSVVLPLMIVALLVASVLWAQTTGGPRVSSLKPLTTYSALVTQAWKVWPFQLSIVFASFWLLSFFAVSKRPRLDRLAVAFLAPAIAVPVLHALLAAVVLVFHWFRTFVGGEWMAFVWGPPLVAMAFVLSVVVLIGILSRDSTDGVREWWSRLGAWLAIYATAWMVIAVAAVYGPLWLTWLWTHATTSVITGAAGWIATVAGGLLAGNSSSTGGRGDKGIGAKAADVLARVAPFVFIAGLLLIVAFTLHTIIGLNGGKNWWEEPAGPLAVVSGVMLAVCLSLTLLLAWRVDINEFSLNAFYRNRLVRCYLGATRDEQARNPQNFTGFDDKDDLPLAFAPEENANGPYHIVNCALNLGGSSDLALHTRHSASFTLSPLYCGSAYLSRDPQGSAKEIGYISTAAFGHRDGGPTLGQAVSVSGAAASPNMGYHTSSVIAFLLTLFNVRLGWWFPNPIDATRGTLGPHFNLSYLCAELFGGADDKSRFVNVSDGGHFENLAAYELVRRRCKVIVISDAECDDQYAFGGLGTLIRMCEVDFGCTISIDIDDIRKGTNGSDWSKRRYAVGTITYDDNSTGILIYVKAAMTGTEDTSVRQYRSSHPTFPHESTGDQFYGEDQFESYRHLGRDIGFELFGPVAGMATIHAAAEELSVAQFG
jgi:hypothetical protein